MSKDPLTELIEKIRQGKISLPPVGPVRPAPKKEDND